MLKQNINSQWLQGLDTPDAQEMKQLVLNNEKLLDKLRQILYNMQVKKEAAVLEDYDSPSWSHKQAHLNGEAAALRKVLDIITIRERDDPPAI